MSFLKRLFGFGSSTSDPQSQAQSKAPAPVEEYNGYSIQAQPFEEKGAFQLCGLITREIDGEVLEHRFIRADRFPSMEVAQQMTIAKARQIIDLEGENIFRRGPG